MLPGSLDPGFFLLQYLYELVNNSFLLPIGRRHHRQPTSLRWNSALVVPPFR